MWGDWVLLTESVEISCWLETHHSGLVRLHDVQHVRIVFLFASTIGFTYNAPGQAGAILEKKTFLRLELFHSGCVIISA